MSSPARKRELGRGERLLPGVWRLRLPLPWPGIPHGNAWALAAGDGIVLVDCGMHEPGSFLQLERALDQVNLSVEQVKLLVCTHAHSDHYGQAAEVIARSGCELWMHPNYEHMTSYAADPEAALEMRIEIARHCGVPQEPLEQFAQSRRGQGSGIAGVVLPHKQLLPGVQIATDVGTWSVHETPGHAPSHVSFFEPDHRLLISGDHLLGRVAPFYDYGWSPDPVGEFLNSLEVVDRLDARLCIPGHGRSFTDVHAHVVANQTLVAERIAKVQAAIARSSRTVVEIVPEVYGEPANAALGAWWMLETLAYLDHLALIGNAVRDGGDADLSDAGKGWQWRAS